MSALKSTILALSTTLLLASIVSGANECSQNARTEVKIVSHDENCHQYVVCIGRIRLIRNCPEGSGWSETERTCSPSEPDRCRKRPKLKFMSVSVTEVEPVISCKPDLLSCPAWFDPTMLVLRAHEDCAKYYLCISFLPVVLKCPTNLWFNKEKCQCDFPENVDCGSTTTTSENPEVTSTITDGPVETESTSDNPEVTSTTTDEPVETESTSDNPEVTSTTTDGPVETESTSDNPEVTSTTTDEPVETESTSDNPEVTSTTTDEPVETESTSEIPELSSTTSTAASTPSSSPSSVTVTFLPETSEATTVPAITTTTEKPPVVVEIMEVVNKVFEVIDALKQIWYDYIRK